MKIPENLNKTDMSWLAQYLKHQIEVNEVINRENLAPGHSPNMNIPA